MAGILLQDAAARGVVPFPLVTGTMEADWVLAEEVVGEAVDEVAEEDVGVGGAEA